MNIGTKIKIRLVRLMLKIHRIKNFNKPWILVYTDSRGMNVNNKHGRALMQDSYIYQLCKKYRVDFFICPEKHTTIVDFLEKYDALATDKYQHVILHCGVVDFSPRPMSNIEFIGEYKKNIPVFAEMYRQCKAYHESPWELLYAGEKTSTIYSPEYLQQYILPRIAKIKNLLWINSNHFIPGWEGNYGKDRPVNIDESVSNFDTQLAPSCASSIDLKGWSHEEIRKYTVDNIHFTAAGFKHIAQLILARLKQNK